MRLLITIFLALSMISCVSTVVEDDNPQLNTNEVENIETENLDIETKKNANSDEKTDIIETSTDVENSIDIGVDNGNDIVESTSNDLNENLPVDSSPVDLLIPSISENALFSSSNMTQLLNADNDSEDWEKFREAYITQYLKEPKYIASVFDKPISKDVLDYLDKGYGIHWGPMKGINKDVERGLLAARAKNMEDLNSYLEHLSSQGKANDYYLLSYITAWTYVKNNEKEKANILMQEDDLQSNINNFALEIPSVDLENLQQATQN